MAANICCLTSCTTFAENRISQIIAGKRAITGDIALRLGHWFRNSAEFWLNLQSAYERGFAQQAAP
jgi:antitoxin HigA-1